MDPTPITKRCADCDEQKSLAEFFTSSITPDGTTAACRLCIFERARRDRIQRESRRRVARSTGTR